MSSPFASSGTHSPTRTLAANTSRKMTSLGSSFFHRSIAKSNNNNNNKKTGTRFGIHAAMGNPWPPTQVRLRGMPTPEDEDDDDNDVPILERNLDHLMDEDPLTYFLTPTKEEDDPMMDFDAGIGGGGSSAADMIRSVSPSQLDGGKKTSSPSGSIVHSGGGFARPPSPPRSPPALGESTDEEMDDEDAYCYDSVYAPHMPARPLLSLSDFTKQQQQQQQTAGHAGRRGRGTAYGANSSRRRLSPRSWRQPSPDVWSIEEEPEDALAASRAAAAENEEAAKKKQKADKSKPKKKVRFVLPVAEESFH